MRSAREELIDFFLARTTENMDHAGEYTTSYSGTDDMSGGVPDQEYDLPEGLSPRQRILAMVYWTTAGELGKFTQDTSTEGAAYTSKSGMNGINCANCVFFDGPSACGIVSGDIAPEGLCKLWVIPDPNLQDD